MNIIWRIIRGIYIVLYAFIYVTLKTFLVGYFKGRTRNMYGCIQFRSHKVWSETLRDYFGVTMIKMEGSRPANEERTIFLVNHRSHADFYLHDIVTEFKCSFLSRLQSPNQDSQLELCFRLFTSFPTTHFGSFAGIGKQNLKSTLQITEIQCMA